MARASSGAGGSGEAERIALRGVGRLVGELGTLYTEEMGDESEIRPLPEPPRCRGIPLGDGHYTGCAYGYGDLTPLTGPCDCPVCHGSGYENVRGTFIPHSEFGDPECCGCLNGVIKGDWADVVCNECSAVIRRVPVTDLQKTFDEMELTLDLASESCPSCGAVNLFPGFSEMGAFTCTKCGELVRLSDDPDIDRFFGPKS